MSNHASYATKLAASVQRLGSGREDNARAAYASRKSQDAHVLRDLESLVQRISEAKTTLRVARDYVRTGRKDDAIAFITRALAELDGTSR